MSQPCIAARANNKVAAAPLAFRRSTRTRKTVTLFQPGKPKVLAMKESWEPKTSLPSRAAKKQVKKIGTRIKDDKPTNSIVTVTVVSSKILPPPPPPAASPPSPSPSESSVDTAHLLCHEEMPPVPPLFKWEIRQQDKLCTLSPREFESTETTALVAGVPMVSPESVPNELYSAAGDPPKLVGWGSGMCIQHSWLTAPIPRLVTTAGFGNRTPVSELAPSPDINHPTKHSAWSPPVPTYESDSDEAACISEFLGDILNSPTPEKTTSVMSLDVVMDEVSSKLPAKMSLLGDLLGDVDPYMYDLTYWIDDGHQERQLLDECST